MYELESVVGLTVVTAAYKALNQVRLIDLIRLDSGGVACGSSGKCSNCNTLSCNIVTPWGSKNLQFSINMRKEV
jgi:hypothetical protein